MRSDSQEQAEMLEAILESSNQAILSQNRDGIVMVWNRAAERIFGYSYGEIVGRPAALLIPSERADEEGSILDRAWAGQPVQDHPTVRVRRDGTSVDVFLSLSPIRGKQGSPIAILTVAQLTEPNQIRPEDLGRSSADQEVLRESESRFRTMADGLPLMVWVHGADGQQQFVNRTFCEFFGVTANQTSGDGWKLLIHPDDVAADTKEFFECVRERRPFHASVRVRRADGAWRWIESWGRPRFSASGEFLGFVGTSADITERLASEEALRQSEEHLRRVLDNLFAFVGVLEIDGTLRQANRAPLEAAGVAMEDVYGKKFWDCIWWDHSEAIQARVRQACQRAALGEVVRFDTPVHVLGDRQIVVDFQVSPLRDAAGHIQYLVPTGIDVTERKRIEEALHASEARFRQLADSMPQLVWTADAQGVVDYYNSRAAAYRGFFKVRAAWQWRPALHPDDLQPTLQAWRRAVETRSDYQMEHRAQMADGSYRWHLSRGVPVADPSGIVKWFGTATDIHEAKQAGDELARVNEELERRVQERTARLRETVSELEHFSYTITHDMRAPLRSMHAFSEILCNEYADSLDELGKDYLWRIARAAGRMDNLISDALSYSKVVQAEWPLMALDPAAVLTGIVESYSQFQPPQADVQLVGSFPRVLGNQAGLTQCASNIIGNAVKFVPSGRSPQVRIWAEERGEIVRFWFEDNGIGIPPGEEDRVFAMFERLSTDYDGTGVGLALVRKVVGRMRGKVGFESEPGTGTRFWIELFKARSAGPSGSEHRIA